MVCSHFPEDNSRQCALCFPEADYEIKPQVWRDKPIVEVFRDGKAWARPWDTHFRFGVVKAAMILYCIDIVQEFALTSSSGNVIPESRYLVDKRDLKSTIQLQTFPLFINSYQEIVEYPFIRLDRLSQNLSTADIGFGQHKAAALVILKNDLAHWAESLDGWFD